MKLTELGAKLCRIESDDSYVEVDSVAEADGLFLLCPVCFAKNGGARGTHGIRCWKPSVPQSVPPTPGRWNLVGTSLSDLSLVADSSSVRLKTAPCAAHFFVRAGEIVPC